MCNDAEELSLDLTAISEFANGCFGDGHTQTNVNVRNTKIFWIQRKGNFSYGLEYSTANNIKLFAVHKYQSDIIYKQNFANIGIQ